FFTEYVILKYLLPI
ncbi:TPA: stress response small protein YobI, partial [Escherichia coli]|nr:stress response small protein YobI [Escherichia coli]EIW4474983.1 stress response small protein YobI [Escherichia coli]EIW4597270.1 stress response small protein YobI [Escherichia coli]EJJ1106796.1 stress response small protein YobI [Escherichia coli]ELB3462728.1 stress response small protein YobI [Escherichia coli]